MQITEVLNEGLQREWNVVVSKELLSKKAEERLLDLSKTVRVKGFRPGKVPLSHVRTLYGRDVMIEIIKKHLEETPQDLLKEKGLTPAYDPEIQLDQTDGVMPKVLSGDHDFTFTVRFEVTPQIDLLDFSTLSVSKYVVDITPSDIEEMLQKLGEQSPPMEEISEEAQNLDELKINFVGRIDGEIFPGGSAQDVSLKLGSQRFIPGFEDQLIGVKAGETREITVRFPQDYGQKDLADREAVFSVEVRSVLRPGPVLLDEGLAQRLGAPDLKDLRETVEEGMKSDAAELVQLKIKRDVLDVIDSHYSFPLPQVLVSREYDRISKVFEDELKKTNQNDSVSEDNQQKREQEYRVLAERRVRLGLVFNAIVESVNIAVTSEDLQAGLVKQIRQYPGKEQEVYDYYRKNPEALASLRGPILEDKVIEHLLEKMQISEIPISLKEFRDLIENERDEHSLFGGHDHHSHDHDHDHEGHHHH